MFPDVRLRRLRYNTRVRDMVRETRLSLDDLIYPMFFDENIDRPREIPSMPGVNAYPVEMAADLAQEIEGEGLPAVILFGVPGRKDEQGSGAWIEEGVVQRVTGAMKDASDIVVIADLCLCEYTSHGHCDVVREGEIINVVTLALYARTAVSQADAGADMIAPSGMMDGMISAIRRAMDEKGHHRVPIMSYAAKYASSFYGPFRDAAESAPQFGDRRSHQMDPANAREALRELEMDVAEGADILMIKPALPYLDVIRDTRQMFNLPVAAYCVSGEYAMIKAAAANGWIDGERVMMETLTSIKRAGANMILTYFAREVAGRLRE
jgi:porphobilinogen synthase